MDFAILIPPVEIRSVVRYFWTLKSTSGNYIPPRYLAMADSSPELIFQYHGGFNEFLPHSANLIAQRSTGTWRTLNQKGVDFFGIRFYPHALHQLTGVPAHEFNDTILTLDTIFGAAGREFYNRMMDTALNPERVNIATCFIRRFMEGAENDLSEKIMLYIMHTKGRATIDRVHQLSGLSTRQLQRNFIKGIGYAPKYLIRMHRFQEAKRQYMFGNFSSLTELAYAGGYSDQSHFNREFKEFSGEKPKFYFDLIKQSETETNITKGLLSYQNAVNPEGSYEVISREKTFKRDKPMRALLVGHES